METGILPCTFNRHNNVFCVNRVLRKKIIVHGGCAAHLSLEPIAGGNGAYLAHLISVIGDYKIIRENGSVYLAALHSRNAGRAVCDIKIFHLRGRVYPLPVQHSVDNILVGVSDAVMDGNGLSL